MSAALLALLLSLLACTEQPASPPRPPPAAEVPAPIEVPAASEEPEAVLALGVRGDRILYDSEVLEAPAGRVRIRLTNAATAGGMMHNAVLVRAGARDAVGAAGLGAGEGRGFVPDHPDVLAATPLLAPGQTGELTAALEPGAYEVICTFSGHYLQQFSALSVGPRAAP